ncbi:MAG: hypothetical protein EON89_01205 [Brevundimonas sp.]|nr:MAG: hypothetical protein EON89_01205 [Brevundimonas sp.]
MTLGEWLNTMIMEDDGDDDGVVPLGRRPHAAETVDRRGRSRRFDDAYAPDDVWLRLSASVDAIARRLETAEQRSTSAIQGVDQAVSGMVRRLDEHQAAGKLYGRRIDDISEELKEGHRRLRQFEHDTGPRTLDAIGKVEGSIGGIASRLYDIEERQRSSVNELRQRMDAVEKSAPGAGSEVLSQVGRRLDDAQSRTSDALRDLERSFASLDQRMRTAEGRIEPEGARAVAQFEKLAETLTRQVEANRDEMIRRLDTVETENRIDRIERAVQSLTDQVRVSEERSARAVEAMGHEVLRIAQNLNGRLAGVEGGDQTRFDALAKTLDRKIEADIGRVSQAFDQRLAAADDRHAIALEKLGGEITRISDRLSERIAESERKSTAALDDIGRRLADSSTRIEQRYASSSGELADRMRQSEERTAALIEAARQNIDRRIEPAHFDVESDWRAAAFPDAAFPDAAPAAFPVAGFENDPVYAAQQAWSADLAPPEPDIQSEPEVEAPVAAIAETADFDEIVHAPHADGEPDFEPVSPFGARAPVDHPAIEPILDAPPSSFGHRTSFDAPPSSAFGQGFGGADVSDALAATAPEGLEADEDLDAYEAETDFVDPRVLRQAAAQGRASSNRAAIEAARAAMEQAEEPRKAPRLSFGLKRGGKSKLQERLDRQAKGSGTVGKALGASAIAVLLTGGGVLATNQLTGGTLGIDIPGLNSKSADGEPVETLALAMAATPVDLEKAGTLYQQATAQLDADDVKGVDTLRQAATLGLPQAQLHLAGLYQDGGKGLAIDPGEARAWAKKAADSGDARGMHAYGMYLFDGVGGTQQRADALTWLEKAANKGLVDSQFNVAKIYETGDTGISANPVEAYRWYLIASRAGDADAAAAVERLRGTMPAAERGAARVAADRFKVEPQD